MHSELLVDDARLVIACAQDARDRGAHILTRTVARSCVPMTMVGMR